MRIKLSFPLICGCCHRATRKMGAALRAKTEDHRITGWLCAKCSSKYRVKDRPEGVGWRTAINRMMEEAKKAVENKVENIKPRFMVHSPLNPVGVSK